MQGRPSFHRVLCLSLLGICLAAAPAWAADEVWVSAGQPSGGQIFKVVVNPASPSMLYALANPGVFKSTDAGVHWTQVSSLDSGEGMDLAVDPVQPSNVYAAGQNDGIWKSADGGQTWQQLTGITAAHVVVPDPVTEGVVYTIANACDVYKSVNGGATWSLIDKTSSGVTGLTGNAVAYCTQIAVDPVNPQLLYLATQVGPFQGGTGARAGSARSGLYTSVDGGATWTQNLPTLGFADVVIDPSNDQNVYAGNYVSNDAGATWAPITGADPRLTVIAVDPANSQVMWGAFDANALGTLWTTTDQGAHWSQVSMPQGDAVYNLIYDPSTPATLYASSMGFGVYKSTDGGTTWGDSTDGITGVFPFDILADGTGAIYMGTEGTGIFKSTDGGVTWVMKDTGIAVNIGSSGITAESMVEASTPGTLYETDQSTVYKTTDGGDTWTALSSNAVGSVNVLAVDPEQPQTVYGGAGGMVMKSTDGGANWAASVSGLPLDAVISLAVDPTDSDVLFAGTLQNGLFKSTDGGKTWSLSSTGMPTSFGVSCVAVDPKTPQNVYACPANSGIYKSTDGGQTWSKAGDISNDAYRILQIDPNDPDVVYAAIPNAFVDVSMDAGVTWNTLGDPGSSATSRRTEAMATAGSTKTLSSSASKLVTISSIAVDPRHAGRLYGAANNGQVYTAGVKVPKASGASSGGGGGFPLLSSLLLLGFAALRRRR